MAEIDKVKEQIGWLKVAFALLAAIEISLIAWVAQHFTATDRVLLLLAITALLLVALAIVVINHKAQSKIDQLGDL